MAGLNKLPLLSGPQLTITTAHMLNLLKVRLVLLVAAFALLASIVIAVAFAFLSDTETSEANTFEAGVLDLKIDNTSFYNGVLSENTTWSLDDLDGRLFFDFHDLKPGDWGEDTISIHVNNNNAWACFDTTFTSDDDVSSNEPELLDGDPENTDSLFDGELGSNVNFAFWVDDGDNVYETGETIIDEGLANDVLDGFSVTLADSLSNLFEDNGPLLGSQTYYIAKAWCFGDFTLNAVAQDGEGSTDDPQTPEYDGTNGPDFRNTGILCDGSELDNTTQTDAFTADVAFTAIQSRNNPTFTCDEPTPTFTPTNTPTPTPVEEFACEGIENPVFATSVVGNTQGLRKNGTAVLASRSNPTTALVPQTTGAAFDPVVTEGTFYSLGFPHTNNGNVPGEITVDMGTVFYNNESGNDIQVWEVTGGTSYPVETVQVFAKLNLADSWTSLGFVNRDGGVELSPMTSARYVRLVEASNIAPFEPTADGYDLDGVQALCTQLNLIQNGQ